MAATRSAIGVDGGNSWLPFTGRDDLEEAVTDYIERRGGPRYNGRREIVITSGDRGGWVDGLFSLTDPGDEVIVTDPAFVSSEQFLVSSRCPLRAASGDSISTRSKRR
jgi:N-succinyldiaminopimelate aminotransferase